MISKLKFALKCNNSKVSFNGCLTNVYDRMKKVYGYNMNEEKKRYYNTYKVHATSTIEVVKTFDDLYSTGFFDYLDENEFIAIEWSENIENALPENYIKILIEKCENDNERKIIISESEK